MRATALRNDTYPVSAKATATSTAPGNGYTGASVKLRSSSSAMPSHPRQAMAACANAIAVRSYQRRRSPGTLKPSRAASGSRTSGRTARRPSVKAITAVIAPPNAANTPIEPLPLIESSCPQNTGSPITKPATKKPLPTISAVASNTASAVSGPRTCRSTCMTLLASAFILVLPDHILGVRGARPRQ